MIKRKFARMEEQEEINSKKKTLIVNFDKSTKTPFQVKFTERGFLIGDTRLSFEFLEAALSKEVNIVLENGTGLVLDAIRMQKILKYKDRI
jgi:CRISPR/Cas system-associated endonuclease Cas1